MSVSVPDVFATGLDAIRLCSSMLATDEWVAAAELVQAGSSPRWHAGSHDFTDNATYTS